MKVGGRRQLVCPPALAYGPAGGGHRLSGKTLIFVIDLLGVELSRQGSQPLSTSSAAAWRPAAAEATNAARSSSMPRPMVDSVTGLCAERLLQAVDGDGDQPVRWAQRGCLRVHLLAEGAGQLRAPGCRPAGPPPGRRRSASGARRRGGAPLASASDTRSAATGRPRSVAAALTASPAATPENPQRVPVPRLPGPWATTATSASSTRRAASSPLCTVTASRSPPNVWPTVTVPASQPASRSPCDGAGEGQRQGTAVGGDVGDGRVGPALPQTGDDRGQRGVQVGHDDRHAGEVVGVAQQVVVRGVLLVHTEHGHLQRRVAGLDQVAWTLPGRAAAGAGIPATSA